MKWELPELFCQEMRETFGPEADEILRAYEKPAYAGVRFNTGKVSPEERERMALSREKVSWTEAGYYLREEEAPGKTLAFYEGLLYVQEPSAMSPAEFLEVNPGERVLDLCAAPGGKSTRLAEKLQGQGVLYANDISASRAMALLRNLERFGAGNIFVTAESPEHLSSCFPAYFDRILVDAPCSGEGMFRKDPSLLKSWMEKGPQEYAPLQKTILKAALSMLKPGGTLLYSTCTFSPLEDEGVVEEALRSFPDVTELSLSAHPLFQDGMLLCAHGIKLLPNRVKGEGHYLALLKKNESGISGRVPERTPMRVPDSILVSFRETISPLLNADFPAGNLYEKNGHLYYLPEGYGVVPGLRYLRTGLYLGEGKKNRFEPSQALAMWCQKGSCRAYRELSDAEALKYLRGDTLDTVNSGEDGLCLVLHNSHPLGFASAKGGRLKNKLDPGWRMI